MNEGAGKLAPFLFVSAAMLRPFADQQGEAIMLWRGKMECAILGQVNGLGYSVLIALANCGSLWDISIKGKITVA